MPQTILYGPQCFFSLGAKLRNLKQKKALLVTDPVMRQLGYVNAVEKLLEESGIDIAIYDGVANEPTSMNVKNGLKTYLEKDCDFLIGLGGGSPLDTAKAVGILVTNPGPIGNYMGIDKIKNPLPPIVCIATTAGTGSEVTRFTIITDTEKDVKMLIGSSHIIPNIAVSDPMLTCSVPPNVTAATGLDAFCHAVEAFVSKKSHPFTDMISLEAIKLISLNLRQAWSNGGNLKARASLMYASTLAGIAFSNSSVTLIHGMSRPLGACFHLTHGLSNAVLLPVWADYSYVSSPKKFSAVAEAMGESTDEPTSPEAGRKACAAIKKLCEDLRVPTLRELKIERSLFEGYLGKMADDAISSGSPENNPRAVTKEDIIELYKKAW